MSEAPRQDADRVKFRFRPGPGCVMSIPRRFGCGSETAPREGERMPATNVIQLRELLRERVPHARLGLPVKRRGQALPTGVASLDQLLGGGLAGGDLTELVGTGAGSGSAQILHAFLRRLATDGRFLALIDGADSFDVDAEDPDVLARMLWVRCHSADEALKAADLVLRDRNLPVVVIDLKFNPLTELRRVSASVWHRFSRLAEQHGTTVLVITPFAMVGGAAARVEVAARLDPQAHADGPEAILGRLQFQLLRQEAASMKGAAEA